jgi:hypothetical protein
MADTKISELTTATSPLAGSEVLPIVQSNTTKKVSVDNLTTGKNVPCSSLTSSGKVYASQAAGTGGFNLGTRDNGSSVFEFYSASGNLQLYSYSEVGDVLTYTSGSGLTLNTGNLIIGTSGKGIDFSATSGTGTSELFDDYEEGVWTPTLGGMSGGTVTYTTQTGRYTKVGRQVTVDFIITVNTNTNTGGNTFLSVPFAAGTAGFVGPLGLNTSSNAAITYVSFFTGNAEAYFYTAGGGTLDGSSVANGSELKGSLTYFV